MCLFVFFVAVKIKSPSGVDDKYYGGGAFIVQF